MRPLARAAAATALLLVGCAGDAGRPAGPAPGSTIPHPPLAAMEPAVARVLEERRGELDGLLRGAGVAPAEQARALGGLGRLYQAHRLVEAAEACYREAHALDPERFDWAYLLGVLAARRGNLEAAAAALRDAVALRPDDLPALIRLADLELDLGRVDPAAALYERARALDPAAATAEYGLGRVAAERRSYDEAVARFERALALQPRASVIHYHLGQAHRQLGRLDEAARHLEQSGPVKVAMPDPLMSQVNALAAGGATYLVQGNTALRDGRLSVAADAFRRAVEADPDSLLARRSLATTLTLLRDPRGAVEQLEAAARLAPDNAQAHFELADALAELGEDEGALEHFERAVELDPGLEQAQFNLANALARLGRFAEAARHYREVLAIDANRLDARSRLGTVLAEAGEIEAAIVELGRVVEQDPADESARRNLARAHFNLGGAHLRAGDRAQALAQFQRALAHDDRLAPAHFNVANLLAASGRLAASLPHFARLRELEPGHPTTRLREATALMRLGRFSEARTLLDEAVGRRPDEPAATHALARLLAGAPDRGLRDGRRALELVSRLLASGIRPSWVETQAMALAEVGRFDDAAGRQRAVLSEAQRGGLSGEAERLRRNLVRYESGLACCADAADALPSR